MKLFNDRFAESAMTIEIPYTNRPEDITRLFQLLPTAEVPAAAVEAGYFKSLGFSAASGRHLMDILKKLGFIDEAGMPASTWRKYASAANKGRGAGCRCETGLRELFKHSHVSLSG